MHAANEHRPGFRGVACRHQHVRWRTLARMCAVPQPAWDETRYLEGPPPETWTIMKRIASSRGVLTGAGKGLTWTLTTVAALFALLVNARNLGLTGWLGVSGLSFADHAAERVLVSPRADSLFAIGDTTMLAATVTDRLGAVLAGARLRWESGDSAIVAVDSSGAVIARGPGRTRVTAWVRDRSASAIVSVIPHPVRVIIPGDSALRIRQGDTLQLAAVALDARGHRITGATPRWHSTDPSVVQVDSVGTAIGVGAGLTRLRAAAGDGDGEVSVRVELAATGLAVVSGAGQRVPAGHPLPEPIVLRAHAALGQPVPGTLVRFSVPEGEGRVDPDSAVTDKDGRVSVSWILSGRAGPQQLVARVAQIDSIVRIGADADPVAGNTRMEQIGGDTTGAAGLALPGAIRVRVTDSAGIALYGVPVRWTALDGGSAAGEGRTDSLGVAAAHWTLGPRAGRQRLLAQVGNPRTIPVFGIVARALPGAPAALALESGGGQSGVVGKPLAKAITVAVRDGKGNPVPGVTILTAPGNGSLGDDPPVTDLRGRAVLHWTLATAAGEQALRLHLAERDTGLVLRATAQPAEPASITIREIPGKKNTSAAEHRLQASVVDAYGNPVRGVSLTVTATSGKLTSARLRSDDSGRVAIGWSPARSATEQRLTVRVVGKALQAVHALRPGPSAQARVSPARRTGR